MKVIYFLLAAFCFVHIYRDYLQIKGVKNWFTQIGHFWNAPKYEKHGMVVFLILGLSFLYLGLAN